MVEPAHKVSSLNERSLLAALLSLGARLDPELEQARDEYMLKLHSVEQTTALLSAAILEDSFLYLQIPGAALFAGATEGRPLNVRASTFMDSARVMELAAAVDPDQHIYTNLNSEASNELATNTLKSIGIELLHSPPDNLIGASNGGAALYLDPAVLTNNLANCASAAERDLGENTITKLYTTLFTAPLCEAVDHALIQLALHNQNTDEFTSAGELEHEDRRYGPVAEPRRNEQDPVTADLMESIKFMVVSLTLFLGTGLVLGHSLA